MFERITDAYIALDANWRYTHVNAKAGLLIGRDPGSLIGRHIWTEFPDSVDNPFRQAYEQAMAEQRSIELEAHISKDDRWFINRIYPSPDGLTIYFLDVTERKRAERMEAGQNDILTGIAAQQQLDDSLEQIARLYESLNPGSLCSILLFDPQRRVTLHGAGPSLPEEYNQAIHGQAVGDAVGSCGAAISRRERVVVADIATHPFWVDFADLALSHGLRACWSTPVLGSYDQVLGTFAVYYRESREPRQTEIASLDKLVSVTAIAIESDQLISRSRERDYFFDMSLEVYCIFDTSTQRIIQSNPKFSEVTGYTGRELAASDYLEFVHPDDRQIAIDAVAQLSSPGMRVNNVVYRFKCKHGQHRWLKWSSIVGPKNLAFAVAHDVTERVEVEAALAFADTHDAITHLPHRLILEERLASMLDTSNSVWVLLVGLDRFHSVNESMGHIIGDDLLKRVAFRLRDVVKDVGHIARFAGDQFVIAVHDRDQEWVLDLAQQLRAAVSRPFDSDDYRLLVTASIGISHSPDHGHVPRDLLRRAEAAMTRAKRQGRDSVCTFSVQQMRDIEERLQLGHRLRGALERGEMLLHYQPQQGARNGVLSGFEALLRWVDPERGSITPDRFIPIAEALGLMPEIGRWVVEEACRQARAWLDVGHRDFTISVNVSAQELQRDGLVERVAGALKRYDLPPDVLCIELTESSLMENVERARATLVELKALGTSLALDDFGTGYSSLAYLKHFPIDKLKIDKTFVSGLPEDFDDAAIARTIVAMAHQLRMVVAAEGVETQAQATFLNGIGCDELQGYHLGRPVASDEAEAFFG